MPKTFKPIDLEGLKTYPISKRKSKVSTQDFAGVWQKGGTFTEFLDRLPHILAADDIKAVIKAVVNSFNLKKTIMVGMGAHVIKVGLNPILIDLMKKGVLTSLSLNGAGIVHDTELAMIGNTSEDVASSLVDGTFGMAKETGEFLSQAIDLAHDRNIGLGHAVGLAILENDLPYKDQSIIAQGAAMGIPVTVHVAMGTDIIHMHPGFNPAYAGEASHIDFRTFASIVSTLEEGVYLNVGSAVIMPEVFLKAITLVRNLGHHLDNFTTVNMDFIRHYRPVTNVVNRPTSKGGQGINLIGHHEILLPIIAAGIVELIG